MTITALSHAEMGQELGKQTQSYSPERLQPPRSLDLRRLGASKLPPAPDMPTVTEVITFGHHDQQQTFTCPTLAEHIYVTWATPFTPS